MFSGVIGKMHV